MDSIAWLEACSQLESYEDIPGADSPVCCALTMALANDRAHFLALPRVGWCCSASTRACCGVGATLLLVLRPTHRRLLLGQDQFKRLEQRPLVLQPDILALYRRDFDTQTDRVLPTRLALSVALGGDMLIPNSTVHNRSLTICSIVCQYLHWYKSASHVITSIRSGQRV